MSAAYAVTSRSKYYLESRQLIQRHPATLLLQDLFGLPNMSALFQTPQPLPLTPQDTPGSRLLFELLTAVRLNRTSFMRLRVAKKGDQNYSHFLNLLVEDKSTAGMSYVEFLCHVHRQIQEKMS